MTLAALLAEREIARALTRLARAMDERDWDALLAILADDATGDLGEGPLSSPQEIVGTIRRYLDACGPTQHLLGNLLIDVDGDSAQSRCYVSDMHLGSGDAAGLTFATLGDYHDHWRREGGRWRLAHRTKHNRGHVGSFKVFGGVSPAARS
jgi:ketosteroid isomerase-like protein